MRNLLHIKKPLRAALALAILASCVAVSLPSIAFAANPAQCAVKGFGKIDCPQGVGQDGDCLVRDPGATGAPGSDADPNKWVKTDCNSQAWTTAAQSPTAINCSNAAGDTAVNKAYCDPAVNCDNGCNLTTTYINPLIKAVSALVGIGVTISIIYGGIQYASSADDPSKVTAAKKRILNSVLTLIGFFLFYQFLNWIIPGGV